MINIKPSTALRTRYNEIAEFCKTNRSPVFLTKNGEGDLVVMDIDTYNEIINYSRIISALNKADKDRANGIKGVSIEEAEARLEVIIKKTEDNKDGEI